MSGGARLLVGLLAAVLVAACGDDALVTTTAPPSSSTTEAPTAPSAAAWQATVDELRALQPRRDIPGHLLEPSATLDGSEFDVAGYFTVLDRLAAEPGFALDYVYRVTADRGFPILYVRRADQPRYTGYDQFVEATGRILGQGDTSYLDQVYVVDGTPEGFFQYVVLAIMGGQFYLYWHAQEDDAIVLTSWQRLEDEISDVAVMMDPDDRESARGADPAPVVSFDEDTATVEVLVFTCFGGLLRHTFTIERVFPQRILDHQVESEAHLENCGVQY
jgi:hypothetical protein